MDLAGAVAGLLVVVLGNDVVQLRLRVLHHELPHQGLLAQPGIILALVLVERRVHSLVLVRGHALVELPVGSERRCIKPRHRALVIFIDD